MSFVLCDLEDVILRKITKTDKRFLFFVKKSKPVTEQQS